MTYINCPALSQMSLYLKWKLEQCKSLRAVCSGHGHGIREPLTRVYNNIYYPDVYVLSYTVDLLDAAAL